MAQNPTRGEEECGASEVGLETPMSSPLEFGPNHGLQATPSSLHFCVAPASRRA